MVRRQDGNSSGFPNDIALCNPKLRSEGVSLPMHTSKIYISLIRDNVCCSLPIPVQSYKGISHPIQTKTVFPYPHKNPHVEVHTHAEQGCDVALVSVGVSLHTRQQDAHSCLVTIGSVNRVAAVLGPTYLDNSGQQQQHKTRSHSHIHHNQSCDCD
jgi:hypothetical protein